MRIPGTSEPSAFHIALAVAAIAAVGLAAGALLGTWYGVAVALVAVGAAVLFQMRTPDPERRRPLRDAAHEPHRHGAPEGVRHLLIVADEVLAGDDLRALITEHGGDNYELDVLAPVHTTRSHLATGSFDRETAAAEDRLRASLAWAAEKGLVARGEVGDPDPLIALEDELRDFGPDAVIVVAHARDQATRLEKREVDRLEAELDIPVMHFVAEGTGPP